jgi:hypothetical protein
MWWDITKTRLNRLKRPEIVAVQSTTKVFEKLRSCHGGTNPDRSDPQIATINTHISTNPKCKTQVTQHGKIAWVSVSVLSSSTTFDQCPGLITNNSGRERWNEIVCESRSTGSTVLQTLRLNIEWSWALGWLGALNHPSNHSVTTEYWGLRPEVSASPWPSGRTHPQHLEAR